MVDAPPHVFEDEIGLQLAAPEPGWRERPDMDPDATRGFRAAIVARARFVEDLLDEAVGRGVSQYVLLGAGLDTFALRRPEQGARMRVFEIDQSSAQAWKQDRLKALGSDVPSWLNFVPVDFEAGQSWPAELAAAGFDPQAPAVFASTGVAMYLSAKANLATLKQVAAFAPGSILAMTFQLPREVVAPDDRPGRDLAEKGARASGTPFVSFYTPAQALDLATAAGFREASHLSGIDLATRYFSDRADGLRPSTGEDFLIART